MDSFTSIVHMIERQRGIKGEKEKQTDRYTDRWIIMQI